MERKSFFASSHLSLAFTLFFLFSVALAIRIYDITDLPLDFHPSRQLFSAIKTRGMYYERLPNVTEWKREFAIQQWNTKVTIEPEILERFTAFIFRYTGEQLWIPRSISAIFWVIGGIFVYLLARDMLSVDGAILALAFYLFVPYGIFASRSFQPDPLMVTLIVAFWWLVYRWANFIPYPKRKDGVWKWAILAGLTGGLAIFVKFVAAFFVIGGALGVLLGRFKLRDLIRDPQVWAMGVLGILPGGVWFAYGKFVAGMFSGDMSGRFIPSMLVTPLFYIQWHTQAATVAGGLGIMLGLLGFFLIKKRVVKTFLCGIWVCYLIFGLYFNYNVSTHDYYSLPLIAIVAISLVPLGDRFFALLMKASSPDGVNTRWIRGALFVILIYGILSIVWNVRNEMKSTDYRPQATYWAEIRDTLGSQASFVALTEDYGLRMAYWGWIKGALWPSSGDLYQADVRGNHRDIDNLFAEVVTQKSLFLVTDLDDFAKQKELQTLLASYRVLIRSDGYLVYDLKHPLESQP